MYCCHQLLVSIIEASMWSTGALLVDKRENCKIFTNNNKLLIKNKQHIAITHYYIK